jgi:ribonuclease HI
MDVVVHTDGASRGNPGPASIGVVITDPQGRVLLELGEALPPTTNNVAEYTAVIRALERATAMGARRVQVRMDSQLVVRQLNGQYKVKHPDMLPLYRRVLELIQPLDEVTFAHVPREMNTEADRLANAALDNRTGSVDRGEEPPDALVRRFANRIETGDWEGAAGLLAEGFRYRRPAIPGELDAASFIRMLRERVLRWQIDHVAGSGGSVLLEATAEDRAGSGASLWICQVRAGSVEAIIEYRDHGLTAPPTGV